MPSRGRHHDIASDRGPGALGSAKAKPRLEVIEKWLAPWWMLPVALFGLAVGNLHRPVFLVLAAIGLFLLIRRRVAVWSMPGARLLAVLFGALWLPMLVSCPDAVDVERALGATSRNLIYLLGGLAILHFTVSEKTNTRLLGGMTLIAAAWTLDGLIQYFAGANMLGFPLYPGGRLTGMFDGSPRLGLVLAILSPLCFEIIRKLLRKWSLAWLLVLPLVAVILLGGSRASWLIFAVSLLLYAVYVMRMRGRRACYRWVWKVALVAVMAGVMVSQIDWLDDRVVAVKDLFSMHYEEANNATSGRLPKWEGAWKIFTSHWLNGVGVRGYATGYLDLGYRGQAHGDDSTGHPHLVIGEIAAESGAVGLAGYLLFQLTLYRHFFRSPPSPAMPWLIAAMLASFPLGSTLAFYGIFASSLLWLILYGWLLAERRSEWSGK